MGENIENDEVIKDVYSLEQMQRMPRPEVLKLIGDNPLLRDDPYTKAVANNDFVVTREGIDIELNPGVFACLRIAMLEQMRANSIMVISRQNFGPELDAAMVIHSGDRVVGDAGVADTQ